VVLLCNRNAIEMMNFYRRFIKDFSQRTGHMRKLLIKDEPFVWSDECQKELDSQCSYTVMDNSLIQFNFIKFNVN